MKPLELFKIAVKSIRSNKIRSLLTMLGLIIGISSVVTILSVGEGTTGSISSSLGALGGNNISISESADETILPGDRITIEDAEQLKTAFPDLIKAAVPLVSEMAFVRADLEDTKVVVNGSSADAKTIEDLTLGSGRFIDDTDLLSRKKVIVIDSELEKDLFGQQSAVGKSIALDSGPQTVTYTIVGVYEKEESALAAMSRSVYIPYTTLDQVFNLKGRIQGIKINLMSSDQVTYDASRVINYLERRHHNEGTEKYEYFSMEAMVDTISETLGLLTTFVSAVAGISLVVGGIGVMNIMLVSVTERTREIGIRKALGAKPKDIMLQFLVEAVIICLIGGIIGVVFGYLLTEVAGILFDIDMTLSLFSVVLSTCFSTAMGVIFGVYPASKASKLDPIEALRYE